MRSLIMIIMPSRTVRQEMPKQLGDFGLDERRTVAAISLQQIAYLDNFEWSPEVLLISERTLSTTIEEKIIEIALKYQTIYVFHHGRTDPNSHYYLRKLRSEGRQIAFRVFNRTTQNNVYLAIKHFLQIVHTPLTEIEFTTAFEQLKHCFSVDWEVDDKLKNMHLSLLPSSGWQLGKELLVVWNDNGFSATLKTINDSGQVAVTAKELETKLKGKKQLLILVELTWGGKRLSQALGFELAQELIAKGHEIDIVFASCLPRNELKKLNGTARLLAPLFPFVELPFDGDLKSCFWHFSETKWRIIRNYYLRRDGIIDKLLHDLRKVTFRTSAQRIGTLMNTIQSYSKILPEEIVESSRDIALIVIRDFDAAILNVSKLISKLQDYYDRIVHSESLEKISKPYNDRIMVVEDELSVLNTLGRGLKEFFPKTCLFNLGSEAYRELKQRNKNYAALIVDMELLDEDENLQEVQGYDLLELAKDYPHLAVNILTVYSGRALGNIYEQGNLSKFSYTLKDPVHGLPPFLNYATFARQIAKQIKDRNKFLVGPRHGAWANGLLRFYYDILESPEGPVIWDEVFEKVERFLDAGHDNSQGSIPKTLYRVDRREFGLPDLRLALIHRLICLYYQYAEGKILFENGIRKAIGFKVNRPKAYFQSILGFSVRLTSLAKDEHECTIQKKNLFPEELRWLAAKLPTNEAILFPQLIYTILDASECLPPLSRRDFPKDLATLSDCERALKYLRSQNKRFLQKMCFDFEDYLEKQPAEVTNLKQVPEGTRILKLIDDIVTEGTSEASPAHELETR